MLYSGYSLPTRNVNLTDELRSGRYENASEVIRAARRALEREEEEHHAKLSALRMAIEDDNVAPHVREKLNLPTSRP